MSIDIDIYILLNCTNVSHILPICIYKLGNIHPISRVYGKAGNGRGHGKRKRTPDMENGNLFCTLQRRAPATWTTEERVSPLFFTADLLRAI